MNLGFVYDLHCLLKESDFSYVYNGAFTQALSDRILSFAESAVDSHAESTKVKKKLYFVMVESLQNVARHSEVAQVEEQGTSSFFIIQSLNKDYYLTSANSIHKKEIDSLRSKLDHVNSLDKDALKTYSNDILTQGTFSEKGGAGLGLVEMARKSGNKLAFDFSDINDAKSYFYFQLKISSENPGENGSVNRLGASKRMHRLMTDHNLNLIYSGDFTQEIVKGILAMTEASIQDERDHHVRNQIFNVVIELLQNVYQHADDPEPGKEGKTGMFLIGEWKDRYVLTASNLIHNSKTEHIRSRMEEVNSLDEAALLQRHNAGLKDMGEKANIGFVDMRFRSNGKIQFEITPLESDYSFFTIQVNIAK
ncbi:MAG: SiaB family protein kinase [Bacteroidia bacterium]